MKKSRKPMSAARRVKLSTAAHDRLTFRYRDPVNSEEAVKKRYHLRVAIAQSAEKRIMPLSERVSLFRQIEKSFAGKIYY